MIRSEVMVFLSGSQEIITRVISRMMREMAMERCTGWMEVCIRVNGTMESSTGLER